MFGYNKLYIDGKLQDAQNKRVQAVICPATDKVIGEVAWASVEDTNKALESAQDAFKTWSTLPSKERIEYMLRLRDLVVENEERLRLAEMYENGKTYEQTEEGYQRVIDSLEYYSDEIKRVHGTLLADSDGDYEHKIVYQAAGVVGAFVAWNFPLLNLAFKIGPAMAAGCPIILRPSPETPISAYIIGELCAQVELPAGVVNILTGPIDETADIITKSKIPAVLTLIGSSKTGRQIMKNGSSSIKRYSMELGGNAPAIIFPDANLDLAAFLVSILKTSNTGQICVAPNRVFVHESIHDTFLEKVLDNVKKVKIGHGKDSGVDMGPLISKDSRDRIDRIIKEAIEKGASLCYGGKVPEGLEDKGAYYMPTVLDNVPDSIELSCEEIFGPVISISTFKDYDEVVKKANNTEMGLSSFVFSSSHSKIQNISKDLDFGEIQINGVKYGIDLPHVGIKQSGIGQDCSHYALEDYLVKKRISISLN